MKKTKTFALMLLAALLAAGPIQALEPKGSAPVGDVVKAPWSVSYHDGSGNAFRFWRDSDGGDVNFEYEPVRPENSSSGVYSGGEAKKGRVNDPRFQELWEWVSRFQQDTSLHVRSRMKGTGDFQLKTSRGMERFLVKEGSPLRQFNEFLAALREEVTGDLQWEGPFPVYPGAVKDPTQGGATSLNPGRNFSLKVYTIEKPITDVVLFYKTHLTNYQRWEDPEGTVTFKIEAGSVKLKRSGQKTRIQITQGPF